MKGRIEGFRGRRRGVYNNYCIIEAEDRENPAGLIGKKVLWRSQTGKSITGKVIRTHGKRSLLARFNKGLPGQAVGSLVEIGKPVKPKARKKVHKKTK